MKETGFGEILRQVREEKGLTLEQAEEATKVRKFYLRALEEDNFEVMPAQVYAIGFVRKYAAFLGLDEKEMVERFKKASSEVVVEDDTPVAPPLNAAQEKPSWLKRISPRGLAAALVFLVLALWLGNYAVNYLAHRGDKNQPVTPPTVIHKQPQPPTTTPGTKTPTAPSEVVLTLTATGHCWYLVRTDNTQTTQGFLEAGDTKEFKGKETVFLHLGNAGVVKVSVNGKPATYLGKTGEVVKQEFTRNQ